MHHSSSFDERIKASTTTLRIFMHFFMYNHYDTHYAKVTAYLFLMCFFDTTHAYQSRKMKIDDHYYYKGIVRYNE